MPRGFGGGFGRGGFGGGFGMRRGGFPLLGMGMGMGMMGMGMGPLMYGGLGYLLGSNSANNQQASQQVQQVAPAPGYYPQAPAPTSSPDNDKLTQLKLLGELHDKGTLTDGEFDREKSRILGH
jgi:membrane protease subunit (stomatin/prohibitin family)